MFLQKWLHSITVLVGVVRFGYNSCGSGFKGLFKSLLNSVELVKFNDGVGFSHSFGIMVGFSQFSFQCWVQSQFCESG